MRCIWFSLLKFLHYHVQYVFEINGEVPLNALQLADTHCRLLYAREVPDNIVITN